MNNFLSNTTDSGMMRVNSLDDPIFRIFPLWFFEEALQLRQLVLVQPDMWEDPYEVLPKFINLQSRNPWHQTSLAEHIAPAYAQCWSRVRESDTLLRAYSRVVKDPLSGRNTCPREEGVQVRSTPRKILKALTMWSPCSPFESCFIDDVEYLSREQIHQRIANEIKQRGLRTFADGPSRAKLLLLKREAFRHEAEVRLIYVKRRDDSRENLIRVTFDPNEVFDDISFDPRLRAFERKEREDNARRLGYRGVIREPDLYQGISLLIDLP